MDHPVDRARLRRGRLERLQATMRAQGVEACVLFNDPNILYATGASAMAQKHCLEPGRAPSVARGVVRCRVSCRQVCVGRK